MIQLTRDPFARTTLVRELSDNVCVCAWCGSARVVRGKVQLAFRYGTESDNGRVSWHRGAFCGKSCHDAYHA
jgi:hypothetical protein